MLLLFKRNDFITFFILLVLAFALRLPYFIDPPAIDSLGNFYTSTFFSWTGLKNLYASSPRVYFFLSTLFWLFFSVYFKYVLINEKLFSEKNFISAMALVLFTAALPQFSVFSIQALSALLLFIAFAQTIRTQTNMNASTHYLLIGVLLGLSVMLYWPSIMFILAAFWILLSLRLFVAQEAISFLVGLILPFYLSISLYYIFTGHTNFLSNIQFGLSFPNKLVQTKASVVLTVLSIFILLYGLYVSRNGIKDARLLLIKRWNAVGVYFFVSALIGSLAVVFPAVTWIYTIIPFSIILGSALSNNLKKYNTFTFYLVLLIVLSIQWFIRHY